MKVLSFISLISAPAAKARSLPVKTITPMASSRSKRSNASANSSISLAESAFKACGRLRRMRPTAPRVSTMIVSAVMNLLVELLFRRQCIADRAGAILAQNFNGQALAFAQIAALGRLRGPAKLRKGGVVELLDGRFGNGAARISNNDASGRIVESNARIRHADQT